MLGNFVPKWIYNRLLAFKHYRLKSNKWTLKHEILQKLIKITTEAQNPFVPIFLSSLDALDQKCVHSDQLQENEQLIVANRVSAAPSPDAQSLHYQQCLGLLH